ncbi:MAG: DNA-binding response regulator [Polaromonas sp.]|nr:DNA-binding response regulator [Polaromonas sp.]
MSIFVIDEHPLMREAIAATLRRLSPAMVVAELGSLDAVDPAAIEHGTPELICVELLLGGNHGVSAVHQLKRRFATVPVVVLSSAAPDRYEKLAFDAGAQAYIHKSASKVEISNTLRDFMPHEQDDHAGLPPEKLSKRQKQLLILLDKGMSNRDIAELLRISEHTVKVHLWRMFRRLNVKSRSQASHLARTHGLLELQPNR